MNRDDLKIMCSSLVLGLILSGSIVIENVKGMNASEASDGEYEYEEEEEEASPFDTVMKTIGLKNEAVKDALEKNKERLSTQLGLVFDESAYTDFDKDPTQRKAQEDYLIRLLNEERIQEAVNFLVAPNHETPVDYAMVQNSITEFQEAVQKFTKTTDDRAGRSIDGLMSEIVTAYNGAQQRKEDTLDKKDLQMKNNTRLENILKKARKGDAFKELNEFIIEKCNEGTSAPEISAFCTLVVSYVKFLYSRNLVNQGFVDSIIKQNRLNFDQNNINEILKVLETGEDHRGLTAKEQSVALLGLAYLIEKTNLGCCGCLYAKYILMHNVSELVSLLFKKDGEPVFFKKSVFITLRDGISKLNKKLGTKDSVNAHMIPVDELNKGVELAKEYITALKEAEESRRRLLEAHNDSNDNVPAIEEAINAEERVMMAEENLNEHNGGSQEALSDPNNLVKSDLAAFIVILNQIFGASYPEVTRQSCDSIRNATPTNGVQVIDIVKTCFGENNWTENHQKELGEHLNAYKNSPRASDVFKVQFGPFCVAGDENNSTAVSLKQLKQKTNFEKYDLRVEQLREAVKNAGLTISNTSIQFAGKYYPEKCHNASDTQKIELVTADAGVKEHIKQEAVQEENSQEMHTEEVRTIEYGQIAGEASVSAKLLRVLLQECHLGLGDAGGWIIKVEKELDKIIAREEAARVEANKKKTHS